MFVADLIDDFAADGKYHFTTQEAQAALQTSAVAARAALRRLRTKKRIAMPYRGFHVIVPPEYRRLGCLPPDQFVPQLMEHLGVPYYAALLSAAEYHGAAHQRPRIFQVMVPKNRPSISCEAVKVDFIARKNIHQMPVQRRNTPRGEIQLSSPEVTLFDLAGYMTQAGGIDNVATVVSELGEELDADELVKIAELSPLPWAQRLGYLMDFVGFSSKSEALYAHIKSKLTDVTPLRTGFDGGAKTTRDPKWKVIINVNVEPDI
ncbi:MAG: type IV toxin-antitoxin system AbiEi family antitoxin [Pirellulales bacterium]|nr:type IV toxin-antitoxin system AbiEi family antitoxin [Pirellulales bacterium]